MSALAEIVPLRAFDRNWAQDTIEWLYGFRLFDWQLDILEKLMLGGIYSILLPTDHGKSMLLEITVVLGLIRDPNSRWIVVKINDKAANETAQAICLKLDQAGERFPLVKPMFRMDSRTGRPMVRQGFWVTGARRNEGRNSNLSVHCYTVGSSDLQGKRGRTLVDDLEMAREAESVAYREQLERRVGAVLRTYEDKPDTLWAMFGTPYHQDSIYFRVPNQLRSLGGKFDIIRLPYKREDGSYLWPERGQKIEIHRRTMPAAEFMVAYELRTLDSSRLSLEELDSLKDRNYPFCETEDDFKAWLWRQLLSQPAGPDALKFQLEQRELMTHLRFYIGWDPATTGTFAVGASAILGNQQWLLDSHLGTGDSVDQAMTVLSLYQRYPSALIVLEQNAQQAAFRDVLLGLNPNVQMVMSYSGRSIKSDLVGVPAWAYELRNGRFHIPYADPVKGESVSSHLQYELLMYGPTAHPHLMPAFWFNWYWHRKHTTPLSQPEISEDNLRVVRHTGELPTFKVQPRMSARSEAAWGRRWVR